MDAASSLAQLLRRIDGMFMSLLLMSPIFRHLLLNGLPVEGEEHLFVSHCV